MASDIGVTLFGYAGLRLAAEETSNQIQPAAQRWTHAMHLMLTAPVFADNDASMLRRPYKQQLVYRGNPAFANSNVASQTFVACMH